MPASRSIVVKARYRKHLRNITVIVKALLQKAANSDDMFWDHVKYEKT